jgi:hypothetical protein
MRLPSITIAMLAAIVVACASPQGSTPSPTAPATGVDGLVRALIAAQVPVRQASTFDAAPLPGRGVLLCVGRQEVRVYEFASDQERVAAARSIDPKDPWHVGNSVVEWLGNPRFWQGDRFIVLYLGPDARTESLLTQVMGPPFAVGRESGAGAPCISSC